MLLLELAAQSVRGFSASVRAALKPGYVVLKSPSELPAPLGGLLMALAFPDGRGGDASFLAPGAKVGRAGVSLQANDGSVWRLVRDLGGSGGLHRLDKATKQYQIVTQDAGDISTTLRTAVGFPSRALFEQLFLFTGSQLPTRKPKQAPKPSVTAGKGVPKLQRSAFDAYGGAESAVTVDPQLKLKELELELAQAKTAAELQFRMDGIGGEIFAAEARLKDDRELRAKVDAAREELAKAPSPKTLGLPEDIVDRVRRHGEDKKRYAEATARLVAEREQAIDDGALAVEPLWKDRQFLGLCAAAVLLIVAAVFFEGYARYLSLLSLPCSTLGALLALRHIEALQRKSREGAKGEVFVVRQKKLDDEFQLTTLSIQSAFDKTGAVTNDEFFALMATRERLSPQLAQLEAELAAFEQGADMAELMAKVTELKAEQEDLNQRLLKMAGGYVREARDVERDIWKLKESLAPPPPSPEDLKPVAAPVETFEDPMPGLLALGSELFASDPAALWGILRDRTAQYLKALTDQRYHGVDVGPDGRATLLAPGRPVPASELPGKDLDLLFLSVRLTLVEKFSAQSKLPIIIEDSFGSIIDPAKQGLVGRMLKHLGSLTQVLHVIGQAGASPGADDVIPV